MVEHCVRPHTDPANDSRVWYDFLYAKSLAGILFEHVLKEVLEVRWKFTGNLKHSRRNRAKQLINIVAFERKLTCREVESTRKGTGMRVQYHSLTSCTTHSAHKLVAEQTLLFSSQSLFIVSLLLFLVFTSTSRNSLPVPERFSPITGNHCWCDPHGTL